MDALKWQIWVLFALVLFPRNYASDVETTTDNFDPDVDLDVLKIIKRHGYPAESHVVQTEDGYLLTVHRIPGNRDGKIGGQPVFLQHGLMSSSADFLDEGNKSLGFVLAEQGYDVWLGNARGNSFSIGHVTLPTGSEQFWNFSWHEMGVYDLPAALKYIAKQTGKPGEILYVGHSMGTTMFFVFASSRPVEAKLVKLMVALAPAAYMEHVRSPIKYLSPYAKDIEWIAKHLGVKQLLPGSPFLKFLAYECELRSFQRKLCEDMLFVICGFDLLELNEAVLPVVLSHAPAGTSINAAVHYAQEINNKGNFQRFDYGPEQNIKIYGTVTPPLYNVSQISVPTYFMYANADLLASPIDVERLAQNIPSMVGKYLVPIKLFSHVDFLFGKHVVEVVYNPMIELFKNYTMVESNPLLDRLKTYEKMFGKLNDIPVTLSDDYIVDNLI